MASANLCGMEMSRTRCHLWNLMVVPSQGNIVKLWHQFCTTCTTTFNNGFDQGRHQVKNVGWTSMAGSTSQQRGSGRVDQLAVENLSAFGSPYVPHFANWRVKLQTWLTLYPTPAPQNYPDLHQSQEKPLAKVGWACPPQFTTWWRPRVWYSAIKT